MKSAVLLIVFNRPDTTRQIFEAIRKARPSKFYVAADGFRIEVEGEAERCDEVKDIVSGVDWPCEFRTFFRTVNLGCKHGPASAIDWFFEHEQEGIILEDDVLPLSSFFPFCDDLLERYRHDHRVMMVSGCNLIDRRFRPIESYFFVRHTHIWGWATWRRAWARFDVGMQSWPAWKADRCLLNVVDNDPSIESYWSNIFDAVYAGRVDAWDYQWTYCCWKTGGLSALSEFNLTTNIGFGAGATHTVMEPPRCVSESRPRDLNFPIFHPKDVHANKIADHYIERYVYGQIRSFF